MTWAGWRSLEFVDPHEEAAFVANDFVRMYTSHLVFSGLQLLVVPIAELTFEARALVLFRPVSAICVAHLVARHYCAQMSDQYSAARTFGWLAGFCGCVSYVLVMCYVERVHGVSIFDDGYILVLFFLYIMVQGLLALSALAYSLAHLAACAGILGPSLLFIITGLHEPQAQSQPLLTKSQFVCVGLLVLLAVTGISLVQTHTRRLMYERCERAEGSAHAKGVHFDRGDRGERLEQRSASGDAHPNDVVSGVATGVASIHHAHEARHEEHTLCTGFTPAPADDEWRGTIESWEGGRERGSPIVSKGLKNRWRNVRADRGGGGSLSGGGIDERLSETSNSSGETLRFVSHAAHTNGGESAERRGSEASNDAFNAELDEILSDSEVSCKPPPARWH